jgi:hypothetical protein
MGSFSRLFLSFDFRADTPDEVLAAFTALPVRASGAGEDPRGQLPPPYVPEQPDKWEPEDLCIESGEPEDPTPWRHDWAAWLANAMDVSTTPLAALSWSGSGRWNLTCHSSFKTDPGSVVQFLSWLGPYVQSDAEAPEFIGHIQYEAERPQFLWCRDGRLSLDAESTAATQNAPVRKGTITTSTGAKGQIRWPWASGDSTDWREQFLDRSPGPIIRVDQYHDLHVKDPKSLVSAALKHLRPLRLSYSDGRPATVRDFLGVEAVSELQDLGPEELGRVLSNALKELWPLNRSPGTTPVSYSHQAHCVKLPGEP